MAGICCWDEDPPPAVVAPLVLKKDFGVEDIPASRPIASIPLHPQAVPCYTPQFPIPEKHMPFLTAEVDRLVRQGKVQEVHSPGAWNSPVFVVTDQSGKLRVVQDFRELNKRSQELLHPLPSLRAALNMAAGNRYYTVYDLSSGFHQMLIDEKSRPLTRFTVGARSFEWQVLPMGVASAPAWFHSFLYSLIGSIPGVSVYIDDILIAGKTLEEHNLRLQQVQLVLEKAGVCVNPSKVQGPAATSVKYLGHQISENAIAPLQSYVNKLRELPAPKTVKQVRKALGAINWIGDFLPNFRQRLAPLQRLTGGSKFVWGAEQQAAWEAFKECLDSWQPLHPTEENAPFSIHVDGSDVGWGACLLQGEEGAQRLVGCLSGAWTATEARWHTREQELGAVLRSLRKWRPLLYGRRFSVFTDHKPNLDIRLDTKINFRKVARWVCELGEYDIEWSHTRGETNGLPDFLSRVVARADLLHQAKRDLIVSEGPWGQ